MRVAGLTVPGVPGPKDLLRLAEGGYEALEQAIALVPRVVGLVGEIEGVVARVKTMMTELDQTQRSARAAVGQAEQVLQQTEQLLARTGTLVGRADTLLDRAGGVLDATDPLLKRTDAVLGQTEPLVSRAKGLLDGAEPSLQRLQPIMDRLASTTSPAEVDAVVQFIDTLPELVQAMRDDVLPIVRTLGTVAPDVRDLLDTTKEFNEILGSVPGLGRIKRRVEERQEQEDIDRLATDDPPRSPDEVR